MKDNPIIINKKGYADPEARVYNNVLYMYVTSGKNNFDVVVSKDLEEYEVCKDILDMPSFKGAVKHIWAPTVIDKNGRYYIVFAANDIHSPDEIGGLYIGVSNSPIGPFKNVLKHNGPLLNTIYLYKKDFEGAQPIDPHLFKDDDGTIYLYYGGWHHLMYSGGCYMDASYFVGAAISDSPLGEFVNYGEILKTTSRANGPGHNGYFYFGKELYTAYHRREGDATNIPRQLCIDKLPVRNGMLQLVEMT